MAKGSHLGKYLEVHSLSSDQVFLSIPLKPFQSLVDGLLNVFFLLFNCSIVYFIYLLSKAAIELTELFSISLNGHNWF